MRAPFRTRCTFGARAELGCALAHARLHNLLLCALRIALFGRYMTNPKIGDMSKDGKPFGTSTASQTTCGKVYKSPKMKIDGVSVSIKLRDTAGFGAKDMETKNILFDTFKAVVTDFDKLRGCILVHQSPATGLPRGT